LNQEWKGVIPVDANQIVSAKVKETVTAARQALDSEDSLLFENFSQQIRELEEMTREAFQLKVWDDYKAILIKLENKETLTGDELEMLKLLIVGEARYYLKYENNLEDWRNELNRLSNEIEWLDIGGLDDIDSLLHLQALCRDARGVLPDITFYFAEKERLGRFEAAVSGTLNNTARQTLIEVLKAMMKSNKM
jgi:hypothetical protein